MTEKKMTKKEVETMNAELKEQLAQVTAEAQRISEAAQQIQAQSANRLIIIRLLETFVNGVNTSLQQLQRDLLEIQGPSQQQVESED
jgi:chromosome condensin MukBEF ATPase and DNA-binding subunit MukB|tara:strand:+ start:5505 stop:5765 length:261 start_codon:yes stop_codon:yes gene_type:complete